MAALLLDHPWAIDLALDPKSDAFEVLENFNKLIGARESLSPVPFIPFQQYTQLCDLIDKDREARSYATYFVNLVWPYVRWVQEGEGTACPDPEPEGVQLPPEWKRALRQSMHDLDDWRCPQIVVCKKRTEFWPNRSEVAIQVGQNASPEYRVLAALEIYEAHPYATSDFDPWNLDRCHGQATVSRLNAFSCRLPKHPELEDLPLNRLNEKLDELRAKGWHYRLNGQDRYYYIPPAGWDVTGVSKDDWRNACKTFPRQGAAQRKGSGPVDHWNRVWVWDREKHTHWDVEFPTRNPEKRPDYCVISHTGALINDPDGVCSPISRGR